MCIRKFKSVSFFPLKSVMELEVHGSLCVTHRSKLQIISDSVKTSKKVQSMIVNITLVDKYILIPMQAQW